MAEDTWRSVAVPLLECIREHGGQLSLLSVEELSQRTGFAGFLSNYEIAGPSHR